MRCGKEQVGETREGWRGGRKVKRGEFHLG